jgi:hypothetical protein
MNGNDILLMKSYLTTNCLQYDDAIHVMVAERKNGKQFSFAEHIAALVYAQLTNQTKWSRIVPHLSEIDALFFHYDPQEIQKYPGTYFADGIFALKCGNISTKAQMNNLHKNIATMEVIAKEYGSMDAFVTSAPAQRIVELLSTGKSKYKMAMLGEALAWEYIRNVGIDGCKPDTHLRRFLGSERMGNASGPIATVDETIRQIEVLSAEVNLPLSSIDNIIWSYCADGYGEVCTATPHCEKCVIHGSCARNSSKDIVPNCANIALTYEKLVAICRHFDYDSEEIGKFIISLVTDKENENE